MPLNSGDSSYRLQKLQQAIFGQAFLQECMGSPSDRPHWDSAVRVTLLALQELCCQYPELTRFLSLLKQDLSPGFDATAANRNPLYGRMGEHRLYSTLLKLARLNIISHGNWKPVMTILGGWLLRRYLIGAEPKASSLRTLVLALRHEGIQAEALTRMQAKALSAVRAAIAQSPAKATALGLCEAHVKKTVVSDAVELFRIEYQRHFAQLVKFAPEGSVQATSGHGALSSSGLRQVGLQLRLQVEAGEDQGMVLCLQVLTRLTAGLLKQMPVVGGASPADFSAWLDLSDGTYCYQLGQVVELRDVPEDDSRGLYVPATDVVSVPLPMFLVTALRSRVERKSSFNASSVLTVGDLVEVLDTSPRASILESEGYRVTLRRVQESLAPSLLEIGLHRWPVALATSGFWLVSKGRRAYSVCSSIRVVEAAQMAHKVLGWEDRRQREPVAEVFIGSSVCPRPEAIARGLTFLTGQCEARAGNPDWEWLNWMSARTSFVACLTLALRNSVRYPLNWLTLASEDEVTFTDKDIHERPCEALPVVLPLTAALREWNAAVLLVLDHESRLADGYCKQLIEEIKSQGRNGLYPVGEIQAGAVWCPANTDTWRKRLPPSMRLVSNFGRHFWPWALGNRSTHQKLVDLLMRHQTSYLPQKGVNVSWPPARQRATLRVAMEEILQEIWGLAGVLK